MSQDAPDDAVRALSAVPAAEHQRLEHLLEFVLQIADASAAPPEPPAVSARADIIDALTTALLFLSEDLSRERQGRLTAEHLLEDAVAGYEGSPTLQCSVALTSRCIVKANRTLLKLLDLAPLQLDQTPFSARFVEEDRPLAEALLDELAAHGRAPSRELRLVCGDRKPRVVDVTAALADERDGVPARVLISMRDVTEQRATEARLAQAQKLEAIGKLAGGAAHDLNNLLTVITGNLNLLDGSGERLRPEDRTSLEQIQVATEQATRLTSQLLAFARQRARHLERLSLNAIARAVVPMVQRTLPPTIAVVLNAANDLGDISIDRGQAEQLLLNLTLNARDAMPDGGRLTITTRNVTLDDHHPAAGTLQGTDVVELCVADTGVGMSPEVRDRIFEPFFTTKGEAGGTGLGLATVWGIVRQAGGHTAVQSTPGAGTTFSLWFPRLPDEVGPRAAPTAAAPTTQAPSARRGTVLLIDDNDLVRQVTARLLRAQRFDVVGLDDPTEATARLAELGDDLELVVTDMLMPGLSGTQVVEALRRDGYQGPVLFISGFTEVSLPNKVDDPRVGFLAKPFEMAQFVAAIDGLLVP